MEEVKVEDPHKGVETTEVHLKTITIDPQEAKTILGYLYTYRTQLYSALSALLVMIGYNSLPPLSSISNALPNWANQQSVTALESRQSNSEARLGVLEKDFEGITTQLQKQTQLTDEMIKALSIKK